MRQPQISDSVHYQAYGTPGGEYLSVPRAAIVTEVLPDGKVRLCILNPTGIFFSPPLDYDEDGKPGSWRYPPA